MERQIYYAIMNLLDGIAISEEDIEKYRDILDNLLALIDSDIEDVADANDCGKCTTWEDVVENLRSQYINGNRISI